MAKANTDRATKSAPATKNTVRKSVTSKKSSQTAETQQVDAVARKRNMKQLLPLIAIVMAVALIGLLTWKYLETRHELNKVTSTADKTAQEQNASLVEEVSKVMVLPTGETPTIADISDVEQLKERPFFANAQNDDKVLLYAKSSLAIIYRPGTKQVVNVASIDPQAASPSANPATPQPSPSTAPVQ
jgi:hypothetical protein